MYNNRREKKENTAACAGIRVQEESGVMEIEREIKNLVEEYTIEFCRTQKIEYDTSRISCTLNISRTLASQHLNRLVKAGELIKIISRPVYYLDRKVIEDQFRIRLDEDVYYSLEDLTELFDEGLIAQRGFKEAVGYDTTLRYLITQCQAAVKYPPCGVPVLLCGEPGTGKTYIARLIYEYAKTESVIPAYAKCLWLNYSRGNENRFDDDEILFGSCAVNEKQEFRRTAGLLEEAEDGFVIIENAEQMSAKCLEKITGYIRTGMYTSRGESADRHSRTRLVFTTADNPQASMGDGLIQVIPVVCRIPSLEARPVKDKEELIIRSLKGEGRRTGKKVKISRKCFEVLISTPFTYNISGLTGCVKTLCANAFLTRQAGCPELRLFLYDLPEEILNGMQKNIPAESAADEMIDIDDYQLSESVDHTMAFFDGLINIYKKYRENHTGRQEFIRECVESMNLYYDYIVFEKRYVNDRLQSVEKVIDGIFNAVSDKYDIYIPRNCLFVVSRIVYSMIEVNSSIRQWDYTHRDETAALLGCLESCFPAEADVAGEVMERIHSALEVSVDDINRVFLILNLQFYNRKMNGINCTALILAHGYSTASSIADVVNKILGQHIFDAVDMPFNATVKEIIPALKKYMKSRYVSRNILLMVDMGSLETITDFLEELSDARVGIINNVSTKAAVSIGSGLMEGTDFETILQTVCRETVCTYRMVDRTGRKNAVLFTAEGGMGITERMIQLFRNSLTDKMELALIPYDYERLDRYADQDEVFRKYNVLFVVAAEKPHIERVPVVMLENIITTEDSEAMEIVSKYFPKEETELFKKNLLKNFSFENVVRHLTILDADKLLDFVADALESLQSMLHIRLNDSATVGLYIHISNMIERIVTNSYFESINAGKETPEEEKPFVRVFHTAFDRVCRHYNVTIPLSEIHYIYTYVQQGVKNKKRKRKRKRG